MRYGRLNFRVLVSESVWFLFFRLISFPRMFFLLNIGFFYSTRNTDSARRTCEEINVRNFYHYRIQRAQLYTRPTYINNIILSTGRAHNHNPETYFNVSCV